ncbi:alanine racemase [Symbiobacterium thermophilum]|uniref:Alanine racemase n=1 Tax=Symbiobacterium thermophilum TaxID=2734 RepID=A0A953LIW1_SYMTR|nr:alanine racemase [Symbiobacterium thermophilum]MBY6275137.1 alanine racemase [Symbiobacterium thermophilum]
MDLDGMRPTWAEVDLNAVRANIRALKRISKAPRLMAVVKANGYGHGAVPVATAAIEAGADWLGVASVEEGVTLRRHGIFAPILVLGYVSPGQAEAVLTEGLRVALFDGELGQALNREGRRLGRRARVHLKVDTGMGRIGLQPAEVGRLGRELARLDHVEVEGVFTHLATADEPGNPYTRLQLERYEAALAELAAAGVRPAIRHAANSAGLMLHPEAHYDMVRSGIAVVGLPPAPGVAWPVKLAPALTWKTRVGLVKWLEAGHSISYGCTYTTARREQIATLPVGYADGYPRRLSNRAQVLIRGRRCPVVGVVTMDQMMVRVPDDLPVRVGDEVVLIGRQGGEEITATELAGLADTISYEIVCGISRRVPRFYGGETA